MESSIGQLLPFLSRIALIIIALSVLKGTILFQPTQPLWYLKLGELAAHTALLYYLQSLWRCFRMPSSLAAAVQRQQEIKVPANLSIAYAGPLSKYICYLFLLPT